MSRRRFFGMSAAASAGLTVGCATTPAARDRPLSWRPDERARLDAPRDDFDVVTRGGEDDTRTLRTRARPVPAGADLSVVAARMEQTMRAAGGVGIAGPQVGLRLRVATLMLDYKTEHPRTVFVSNPVIVERSDETIERYEGCLSIPGVGGLVRRSRWIRIERDGPDGGVVTEESEGHNAVLWQHELDHLDGVLYTDRVLSELLPMDEVRRRREALERQLDGTELHSSLSAIGTGGRFEGRGVALM